jgi:prepilin-type N-terminal cleavage/methylation domain-containing protein
MTLTRTIRDAGQTPPPVADGRRKTAFTLVELMVVIVIIGILASLSLAGLAGVRQRAKIEKTKNTIRKIDAVIQPMYESYLTRRVPITPSRLQNLRTLMAAEMPDNWTDVTASLPAWALTPGPNRYRSFTTATSPSQGYGGAECLFLIVAMGGFDPWAIEGFRSDEIGDIDNDGAREFWDGWGRPISFIRWPVGFISVIQPALPDRAPDPFDRRGESGDGATTPLVFSAGPDEAMNDPLSNSANGYALVQGVPAILNRPNSLKDLKDASTGQLPGEAKDPMAVRDNITNHDLIKK